MFWAEVEVATALFTQQNPDIMDMFNFSNVSGFALMQNFAGGFAIILMINGWACSAQIRGAVDEPLAQEVSWIYSAFHQGLHHVLVSRCWHDFEFTRIRIIAEADMKRPCIQALITSQSLLEDRSNDKSS